MLWQRLLCLRGLWSDYQWAYGYYCQSQQAFDELYIGLFYNKDKQAWDIETCKRILKRLCRFSNVKVITAHDSLAVDVARDLKTYLLGGLRDNATDFDYEVNMDYFNKGWRLSFWNGLFDC